MFYNMSFFLLLQPEIAIFAKKKDMIITILLIVYGIYIAKGIFFE